MFQQNASDPYTINCTESINSESKYNRNLEIQSWVNLINTERFIDWRINLTRHQDLKHIHLIAKSFDDK